MISLIQQSKRELLLQATPDGCDVLANAIRACRTTHGMVALRVNAHSPALGVREPRCLELEFCIGKDEILERREGRVVFRIDDETADALLSSITRALELRSFSPAELLTIPGPKGTWLRLFGEFVEGSVA